MGAGERLLQHADDRHDARHGALEAQLDLVLARASLHSSSPWEASSSLLAETTCLPACIARST